MSIFIKLLGVMAAVFAVVTLFLFIPPHFAKKLASTGDKYKEIPLCAVTAAMIVSSVVYCLNKNTFAGFVASWATIFLLFCFLITLLRFFLADRKYKKLTFAEKKRNFFVWANLVVLVVIAVAIFAVDRKSSDFPNLQDIETVYYGFDELKEKDSTGKLMPEYSVLNPEKIEELALEATSEGLSEEERNQLVDNLKATNQTIRTDEESFNAVLEYCDKLDDNFFKQRFSRSFKTSDEVVENPYLYVVFRTKGGDTVSYKYEYGEIDIALTPTDYYNETATAERIFEMQKKVENPEPEIKEVGVFFRRGGQGGEQLLASNDFEFLLKALIDDEVPPENDSAEVSVGRMSIFIKDLYKMPVLYSAYGFENREVTMFYNITNENQNSWDYLSTLLEIE